MNAAAIASPAPSEHARAGPLARSAVLVGLMGAGKSSVGRRLARLLGTGFVDADDEVVAAAGMSIADIFTSYGEPAFRDLERRVVLRLLDQPPAVLALGGGAFIDPAVRSATKAKAVSVWLRTDLDTLVGRTSRKRTSRPLLAGDDPRGVLAALMQARHPIYALADHTIDTAGLSAEHVAGLVATLLGRQP